MKRSVFAIVCVLTLSVALCACAGDKTEKSSQIVVGIAQDLEDSLDPHKAVAAGTREVLFNVFEGLLKPDCDGNIIPAVAESYEVLSDGQDYIFHLRSNVKFHNGKNVSAEDVKYSLDKIAGKMGDDPMIPAYSLMEEVTIEDEKTVRVHLSEPNVDYPAYLAMVNAAIIPADNASADTEPVGTGPFSFTSRSVQESIVLERFDDYWGTKAYLKKVTFKVVPQMDTVVMNLRGGSLDMYAHLTTDQVSQLTDDFTILEGTMNLVQALYLNN
ncbi:MAG: ABC transporter substrate-binding protein, partial [Lachnospiraceae bacterium]|nr:ABC transporter substrate-binding protein [Lachnospiraceae bacterium]